MNMVYVRVALFFLAPLLAMLPGVTYDGSRFITIDLETAAIGITGAAVLVAGTFKKWGKK